MRAVRAIAALLALAALLVGAPWALARFGNVAELLTVDWVAALTGVGGGRLMMALLSAAGWAAWLVLALTTLLEIVAVASRYRVSVTVPGTGWLRPVVSALVLAAVGAPGAALADAAAQPPLPVPPPGPVAAHAADDGARARTTIRLPTAERAPRTLSPAQVELRVVVKRGDSLWLIAERELGDPERWREIYELNRDQIADPDLINVGWALRLPSPSPVPADVPSPGPAPAPGPAQLAEPADETPSAREAPEAPRREMPAEPEPPPKAAPRHAVRVEPNTAPGASPGAEEAPSPATAAASAGADQMLLAAPLGAALAGAILLSVATRRRAQLLGRAVGRRLIPASPQVTRFWAALARRADEPRHARDPDDPTPTTLVLGWREGAAAVTVDLESARATLLHGPRAGEALAAALTSLACAPWSEEVEVVVAGAPEWVDALDDPRFDGEPGAAAALARLARLSAERRLALREHDLTAARADRDAAGSWRPAVFVFAHPLTPVQLDAVADALALGETGVSVLALARADAHIEARRVRVEEDTAFLEETEFAPQLLSAPATHALLALLTTTGRTDTEPAPWWRQGADLPPNVLHLPPAEARHHEESPTPARPGALGHPRVLLLGPVELLAGGAPPSRAAGQCLEYCAWLLAHPGATSTTMVRELLVAEGTRRSNMSRLRAWLGADGDGLPYLPDAYNGRIALDPRVTSDWEDLQLLVNGGVNLAPDAALRQALALVRGEPLGDVAFQWHWAEQLRVDMVGTVVDAACALADRAIARGDHTVALWAAGRGLVAAPSDDHLTVRRVDALMVAGRRDEARQLVVTLNRELRAAGRDLPPDLARRVHIALHSAQPGEDGLSSAGAGSR